MFKWEWLEAFGNECGHVVVSSHTWSFINSYSTKEFTYLNHSKVGGFFPLIPRGHMNILLIIKVEILFLFKQLYMSLPLPSNCVNYWTIKWWTNFGHTVESLSNTYVFGVHSWIHTWLHTTPKQRYLIKINNQSGPTCLNPKFKRVASIKKLEDTLH